MGKAWTFWIPAEIERGNVGLLLSEKVIQWAGIALSGRGWNTRTQPENGKVNEGGGRRQSEPI